MKIFLRLILSCLLIFPGLSVLSAQDIVLRQSNESGIYAKGEEIIISARVSDCDADSVSVRIWWNFSENETTKKMACTDGEFVVFKEIIDETASVVCELRSGSEFASLGLVVNPAGFKPGSKAPKDIHSYWKKKKKTLRTLSMVINMQDIDEMTAGYFCSNVEINTTGPKPATGYYAKPAQASPKSLPIVLLVHAAGVKGSWCLSKPENALKYAKMGKGALCFDLNAHGMLNGQPQEYYDELEAGELKGYYYKGMESRDEYYFGGMYLRLIRTLDFLTAQPEWDGKRIIVIGESQGGGQALIAAALDKRVTAAVATVPAMCDWGGPLSGRKGGWPNPIGYNMGNASILEAVPYFDAAHLLKKSKATLVTEIGFIDTTCPSTSIYAAINQSKGKKIIYGVPYRGHHLNQKSYQKVWEETVYKPKMKFIEDFLE